MIGCNVLADFYGVRAELASDSVLLSTCLQEAAERVATPVSDPIVHVFDNGGLTAAILLAESHITFHTYPEHGYVALDVFSCGDHDPEEAVEVFRLSLLPERITIIRRERGTEIG